MTFDSLEANEASGWLVQRVIDEAVSSQLNGDSYKVNVSILKAIARFSLALIKYMAKNSAQVLL